MAGGRCPSIWVMSALPDGPEVGYLTAGNERRRRQPLQDGPSEAERAYNEARESGQRELAGRSYRGAQSETKEEAGHSGEHWADDELAIIARPDLSIKEAALMLGRTYASVARRRHLLRGNQNMTKRAEPNGTG